MPAPKKRQFLIMAKQKRRKKTALRALPDYFATVDGPRRVFIKGKKGPTLKLAKGSTTLLKVPLKTGSQGTIVLHSSVEGEKKIFHIDCLFVPEPERGKGNGALFVDKAIALAKKKGFDSVRAETREGPKYAPVRRLLKNKGFYVSRVFKDSFSDKVLIFEKKLK